MIDADERPEEIGTADTDPPAPIWGDLAVRRGRDGRVHVQILDSVGCVVGVVTLTAATANKRAIDMIVAADDRA
jgi:hypothetical protein